MYLSNYLNYGLTLEELHGGRPIVGIAQTGSDLTPCNRHHVELAKRVKDGIRDAGGVPIEFPVHPIQEAGKRPTASLDRNLAYVGLVEVLHGYPLDGVVLTTGCDKTTPACLMAAATVNIPAIVLSGGPKLDGWWKGKLAGSGAVVWESRKLFAEGKIAFDEMVKMISSGEPSIGHCNTMGTALSMNALAEAVGMSLPGCAAIPAAHRDRSWMAYETGRRIVAMIDEDLRPSDILTKGAFENAVVAAAALGASSNCPPHMIAIARQAGVDHTLDDWDRLGPEIPLLVDCQPAGRFLGEAFYRAGGMPGLLRELLAAGKLNGDVMTVSGRTMAENLAAVGEPDREVIRSYSAPLSPNAGQIVMRSNFFDRAVMKTSVIDAEFRSRYLSDPARPNVFEGRVVVFEGPEDYHERIDDPALGIDVQTILVIRNCGPVGYPGAAEVVNMQPPAALINAGIRVAADARRRPPERHVGQPLDPQRLAGGGGRRRHRAARHRGQATHRPQRQEGRRAPDRRGDGGPPRRLAAAEARQPDALAGDGAPLCRAARRGRMPGAAIAILGHHRQVRRGAPQPLTYRCFVRTTWVAFCVGTCSVHR